MNNPTSLHPIFWTITFLVALPLVLLAAALIAVLARHDEAAHSMLNVLRHTLLVEAACILVLAAWGAAYERISASRDRRLYPPPGRLIDVGGYRLHLDCNGEGSPTVVLEHGLIGSYLDWYQVQPEIARFTRVCSYDRAGYGWSDRSPQPRLPSAMAEELYSLLEKAGEKPPFLLVGHSMGAFDALMYAHRYPKGVSGVVLVDGSHPDESMPFPWQRKLWLRFMQLTSPFGLPRWRNWCASGAEPIRHLKAAVNCKARVFATHYDQWSVFPSGAEEIRQLPSLGALPMVVISRDPNRKNEKTSLNSEQRWMALQEDLLRLSYNGTHVVAEGSGHGVPLQRPDVIVDSVRRIVQQARGTAPCFPSSRP
jgi:pimeloyl-ACP methyl ester carboxylesterase